MGTTYNFRIMKHGFLRLFQLFAVTTIFLFSISVLNAQKSHKKKKPDIIKHVNPSFEGKPGRGGEKRWQLKGWENYAALLFMNETAPDIHPNNYWGNEQKASHGKTFVGMVIRDYGSYEAIMQRLPKVLKQGKVYEFSLDLCIPEVYKSQKRDSPSDVLHDFNNPVRLIIEGLYCRETIRLDASPVINHTDWRRYTFSLHPQQDISAIILSVDYGSIEGNNAAILIDNASVIFEILP